MLPLLYYYLNFIYYFGFSINPAHDAPGLGVDCARYLSIRAIRRLLAHDEPIGPAMGDLYGPAHKQLNSAECQHQWRQQQQQRWQQQQQRTREAWQVVGWKLVKLAAVGVKFMAIAFTTFIAINHCLVLADYIYQQSKAAMDLMLEVRLVITKLSALIFVLSWQYNQSSVRQLIRLVRSTSANILGRSSKVIWPGEEDDDWSSESAEQTRSTSDSTIVRWWLMCVCVTLLHFGLSEVEVSNSHHLWQWLDDYSMHQLDNRTVSEATLLFLASFDNYIYTVHVYGTRLIGASIICIVCSVQSENIASLRWHTLRLIRGSTWRLRLQWSRSRNLDRLEEFYVDSDLYFALNESSWLLETDGLFIPIGEDENGVHCRIPRRPRGRLSLALWETRRWLARLSPLMLKSRSQKAQKTTPTPATLKLDQLAASMMMNRLPRPNLDSQSTPSGLAARQLGDECDLAHLKTMQTLAFGPQQHTFEFIERQFEKLADKYDLVRTVNTRIEVCFGPMLLIQFSFLFLMSCIDVVYFSISFNPNTKTKNIIISGMILLWWPYLLLYKFASDIDCQSKKLLTSIRRLARLSLIERHQFQSANIDSRQQANHWWLHQRPPSYLFGGTLTQTPRLAPDHANLSIINKLDCVFKPTSLTIMGIMTINKFFLLNFAKIVITASVMMIQFVSSN